VILPTSAQRLSENLELRSPIRFDAVPVMAAAAFAAPALAEPKKRRPPKR
jgi:hypothetical protein